MIPSENYCSKAVLEASGSILMNKYAEGYPKKRYYQGNRFIDDIEILAIERAKKLFNAEHVNVQPNSGSPANMAVYFALLERGDKILGMNLSHGGHLTHGSKVNFSGKYYNFVEYGVEQETETLDMEKIRKLAETEKPKLILSGYTAYPRTIDFKKFHEIAESVGAISMADISHIAGLIAGEVHPSPFPFTDVVTTTTHKTLRGPRSAIILCKEKFAQAIDKAVFPGLQGGPHEHTIAAKAVCFKEAMDPQFKRYARQIIINAKALAEKLMSENIKLVSNGTDNHLILIDLINTKSVAKPGLGKEAATALEEAGIITNANTIPFDPSTPFKPSGIRLGTPILTTRGMKETEMRTVGKYIADVINNLSNTSIRARIREEVKALCTSFPFY
jgi:glycine hydroxymethyltransferase